MSEVIKKARVKHVGYAAQREFCRNNKYTYMEKFGGEGVLFCNFPFPEPSHKKGVCRASTCTDMREIPAEISDLDAENELSKELVADEATSEAEDVKGVASGQDAKLIDNTIMPAPSNE